MSLLFITDIMSPFILSQRTNPETFNGHPSKDISPTNRITLSPSFNSLKKDVHGKSQKGPIRRIESELYLDEDT